MDGRSGDSVPPEDTALQLRKGRGSYFQMSAMWPRLQGETQSVEASEIRVRRSQELQLRPLRTLLHAKRQSTSPPDAQPQLLSAAEETERPEDRQVKKAPLYVNESTPKQREDLRPRPAETHLLSLFSFSSSLSLSFPTSLLDRNASRARICK